MNKKKNRLRIFILLLGALCCVSQTFSARRGILSNIEKKDSPPPDFSSLNKKLASRPSHPSVPHDGLTFTPNKLPVPPGPSKRLSDYSPREREERKEPQVSHAEKREYRDTPTKIKTETADNVTFPVLPKPPALDRATLEGKVEVPEEKEKKYTSDRERKDHKDSNPENKEKRAEKHKPNKDHNKKDKPKDKEKKHTEDHRKEEPKKKTLTSAEEKHLQEALSQKEKEQQMVRFYFEDATLENLVRYIEELYDVKFFTDDDLNPIPQGGAILKGHKITFTTNKPLTRTQAWDLFLKFLDMAGLTIVPGQGDSTKVEAINPSKPHKTTTFYRITTLTGANKEVLPTFFNTKIEDLPDNSTKVRYVFFVKNSPLGAIQEVVKAFSSSTAGPILTFPDLNALIVTDKGSNIRSLMKIVKEFDKEMPEAMSVLKLRKSDAEEVAKLYQVLTRAEAPKGAARFMNQRNQPKALYFPANARIIPEPRTNSLVLLGPKSALVKIEEFIIKHIDVELDMPYSPLHIYELQYTQANNIAQILNTTATKFGSGTPAAQYGGVRDGNQYFGPMTITSDPTGNRLIIKAEENDYTKLVDIIKKLDVVQPQAIVEVLIVDVETSDDKVLGTQIRNKSTDSFIKNVDFQRTGFPTSAGNFGGVVNASNGSLLGNLISLASSAATGATVLSVGNNSSGIWGIMSVLQQTTKTDIISNPFLLATNNYQAKVTLGSSRNIVSSTVTSAGQSSTGYAQDQANLEVTITPQISSDGSIQMAINISIQDYSSATASDGNKTTKSVQTVAIVQNREVLVLGGIIKNKVTQEIRKTPLLGDIPGLGWLFKSKAKTKIRSNVLIFISPQIIYPGMSATSTEYMEHKVRLTENISRTSDTHNKSGKDPINNFFFGGSGHDETITQMDEFMQQTNPKKKPAKKKKIAKITRKSSKKRKRFKG